jgi:pimeloyl-ACP methyl ester carboxylesterase
MWSRQIASLSKKHQVIAPDYRGLGKSPPGPAASTMELLATDVLSLLDHLGVRRAAFVGLSMGGYLALEIYRRSAGAFRGLALCDTRAGADAPEAAQGREKFAQTAIEKGLGWVADEMALKVLRSRPDPATVKEIRHLISQGTPAGVAAAQRGMARRPDSFPTLGQIAVPTLVVVGAEDALTPRPEAEKIAAAVKGAKLVEIPNAGHISNIENPEAFDAALRGFLDALPG